MIGELKVRDQNGNPYSFENWGEFLDNWSEYGDVVVQTAVRSERFMPWLAEVQPARYALMDRVFGVDAARWRRDYLVKAFLRMSESELAHGDVTLVARFAQCVGEAFDNPKQNAGGLARFLTEEAADFLAVTGREREIAYWEQFVGLTITLPSGDVKMDFRWCPATTSSEWKRISNGKDYFLMGSPGSEIDRNCDEAQHRVTLTKGFWMGKYPVTQQQWESVMKSCPARFKGADRPVERVSWLMCQNFISKVQAFMSKAKDAKRSVHISLPTEAQWEYACRAGTDTPFNFGNVLNGTQANCRGDHPYGTSDRGRFMHETVPVGFGTPNRWGLYDMHGNVWEWCQDWYGDYCWFNEHVKDPVGAATGNFRVFRGGGWCYDARYCRSANRNSYDQSRCHYGLGFRLVCADA